MMEPAIIGSIITSLVFILGLWWGGNRAAYLIGQRVATFDAIVAEHARILAAHSLRMEKQDELLLDISANMNRIVGRLEMVNPQSVTEAAAQAIGVLHAAEAAAMRTVTTAEQSALKTVAAAAAAAAAARITP